MSFLERLKKIVKTDLFWMILFAVMAVVLVILDQVTKWAAQNALKIESVSKPVIENFFYFALYHNTAVAFSIGEGLGVGGRAVNIVISILMSSFFVAYYIIGRKKNGKFMKFLLMLLAAGAVGNLIDRAFYWKETVGFDGVIDFLQFYLGGGPQNPQTAGIPFNPFPVFNLADSYLTIGVVLFLVYVIVDSIKNRGQEETEKPEPINPLPKGEVSSAEKLAEDQPVVEKKEKEGE